jgi:hypothetical protein
VAREILSHPQVEMGFLCTYLFSIGRHWGCYVLHNGHPQAAQNTSSQKFHQEDKLKWFWGGFKSPRLKIIIIIIIIIARFRYLVQVGSGKHRMMLK